MFPPARLAVSGLTLSLIASLAACGAPPHSETPEARYGEGIPGGAAGDLLGNSALEVSVATRQLGASLSLQVEGRGHGVSEGAPFEDPQRWQITATHHGRSLKRLVNGPVRIAREPVAGAYGTRWDTIVNFQLVFQVPATATVVDIHVNAPESGSEPLHRRVRLRGASASR